MSRSDPFDLVGEKVGGKYRIEEVVDETSFSVIYRAVHLVWQRNVAIKAFKAPPDLTEDARQQLLAGFVQEGAILADLSERSAAVCQARDVASVTTADGHWIPYMVLEWLDGECLELTLFRERADAMIPRSAAETVRLLDPIARALALAHAQGIVHHDVKPGNIFLIGDPRADTCRGKLLDFGIAKAGKEHTPRATIVSRSFTPAYGAPEQFSPDYGPTGPWTDVFAFALIVVELLTGREAFVGDDLEGLARQACDLEKRPTPRALGTRVAEPVEEALRCALSVHPLYRYPDAGAFWEGFTAAVSQSLAERAASKPAPIEPARQARKPPRPPTVRRRAARMGGVLLAGVALTGFVGFRQARVPPPVNAPATAAAASRAEVGPDPDSVRRAASTSSASASHAESGANAVSRMR